MDAFARLGKPQRLQHDRRARGKRVVEHDVVEITVRDAGHRKRSLAGNPRGRAQRESLHLRHRDMLSGLARAPDVDGFFGTVLRPVSPRQHHRPTGIRHQTNVEDIERVANGPGVQYFCNRQWITIHGLGMQRRPGAC